MKLPIKPVYLPMEANITDEIPRGAEYDEKGRFVGDRPLAKRREILQRFARRYFERTGHVRLSPATGEYAVARKWFGTVGSALDGIVAKRVDFAYRSGERTGMQKIKRYDTVDCVVGGFRYASKKRVVGSLLLGLYDEDGLLHHVGFTSGIKASEREALTAKLEPLIQEPGFTGRAPGGPSRWSTERSAEWMPLRPKLVVEVSYDHFTGGRFRHGTRLLRWRPDQNPKQCTMDQVRRPASRSLELLDSAA
jgi:ATP-dependent DNA ligase